MQLVRPAEIEVETGKESEAQIRLTVLPMRSAQVTAFVIILFFMAFLLSASLLNQLQIHPDPVVRAKLLYFEQHKNEFDVLFFGSSRILRGVVSPTFDDQTRQRGVPTHSFNFGMDAMERHEVHALLRAVLANHPSRLKWVFVEMTEWHGSLFEDNLFKPRTVWWHDLPETRRVITSVWRGDASWSVQLRLTYWHVQHCLLKLSGIGRGTEMLELGSGWNAMSRAVQEDLEGYGGYVTAGSQLGQLEGRNQGRRTRSPNFQTQLRDFEQAIEQMRDPDYVGESIPWDEYNVEADSTQTETIAQFGAVPIHLIPALTRKTPQFHEIYSRGFVRYLLAFNDPIIYESLYQTDKFYEWSHFTWKGSEEFSRLLADRFVDEIVNAGATE